MSKSVSLSGEEELSVCAMQPQIWNIVALAILSGCINLVSPLPQNSIWEVILGGGGASSEEQSQGIQFLVTWEI